MELILLLLVLEIVGAVAFVAVRRGKERQIGRREDELAPLKKLVFEDITAFGEDLQHLDLEVSGHELDEGAHADYQRALDAYESVKLTGDSITQPEDVRHIAEIIEDGRYAIACVRAGVKGESCQRGVRRASSTQDMGSRSPTYLHPGRRRRTSGASLRPRRGARSCRRRTRHTQGLGRPFASSLLGRRPRVRAVRRRVLRRRRAHLVIHSELRLERLGGGDHGYDGHADSDAGGAGSDGDGGEFLDGGGDY